MNINNMNSQSAMSINNIAIVDTGRAGVQTPFTEINGGIGVHGKTLRNCQTAGHNSRLVKRPYTAYKATMS